MGKAPQVVPITGSTTPDKDLDQRFLRKSFSLPRVAQKLNWEIIWTKIDTVAGLSPKLKQQIERLVEEQLHP